MAAACGASHPAHPPWRPWLAGNPDAIGGAGAAAAPSAWAGTAAGTVEPGAHLADFPFTGAGIGTFDRVVPILYPLFLSTPGSPVSHAHNLILQVGVDLGLPGLIAWLAVLVNTFLLLAGVLRQRQDALPWALAAGVAGSLGVMLVHGLVDAALWGSKPAFLPWLFVALAVVVSLPPSLRPARPSA
ncbi:MAG: O-antigen ligase family protein [Caldilineales bacterium]|nr:O-antigen ligase family protein [Caldilineales bacterium]